MEKRINPEKLKEARISRGLTKKALADRTGISRQMISNYELGKTNPGSKNLLSIIKVLDFPFTYFTTESKTFYEGTTFFRSQSAATKKSRDMQSIRLKFQKEIYDFLSQYVNFPKLRLPSMLTKSIYNITDKDIEDKVKELRNLWEISTDSPVTNLIKIAESNGIIIVESTMSDDTLDAVSEWIEDRPFIMLTDNNESAVRRRFNVAHEIGHIILHGDVESIHDYTAKDLKRVIERQANYFASCLLLPEEGFVNSLLSTRLGFYVELKKYWKVSIQAMIMRTEQLDLINEDQKLYLFKQIASRKWKKVEPLDDTIRIEIPTVYNKVFNLIVSNNLLSKQAIISSLKLPTDELEKSFNIKIRDESTMTEPTVRLRLIK